MVDVEMGSCGWLDSGGREGEPAVETEGEEAKREDWRVGKSGRVDEGREEGRREEGGREEGRREEGGREEGGREEGRIGVEGVERDVSASESSWVVSGITVVSSEPLPSTPGEFTAPWRGATPGVVMGDPTMEGNASRVGVCVSNGDCTSCISSIPPRKLWSRNPSPS